MTVLVRAEMVGRVWTVAVAVGDLVEVGRELLALESMKMEIPVAAPVSGTVRVVHVAVGDVVSPGDHLITIG